MKILILGCKGQLGRCLNDQLSLTNYEIKFTSRELIDIEDFETTRYKISEFSPDVVVNACAYTQVDDAEKNPKKANLINNLAVENIASVCQHLQCWLIHISTDYVFDGNSDLPYKENDETNPLSIYGKTKLGGELSIKSSGCKFIIIRTAWVFSEYGKNFLKTMLRLGEDCNELRIVNDQIGRPTYAQDIAVGIKKILKQLVSENYNSGIYHYTGDSRRTWAEFCRDIFYEAEKFNLMKSSPNIVNIKTKEFPTLAKRPMQSELDSSKIKATFGIDSSNYNHGIRSTLKSIKNLNKNCEQY